MIYTTFLVRGAWNGCIVSRLFKHRKQTIMIFAGGKNKLVVVLVLAAGVGYGVSLVFHSVVYFNFLLFRRIDTYLHIVHVHYFSYLMELCSEPSFSKTHPERSSAACVLSRKSDMRPRRMTVETQNDIIMMVKNQCSHQAFTHMTIQPYMHVHTACFHHIIISSKRPGLNGTL